MTTTSGNIATTPMGFLMNAPPPWPYSGGNPQDVPLAIIRGKKKKKRVLVTALEEGRQSRLKAERKAARAAAKAGADAPAATPAKAAAPPQKAAKEATPKAPEKAPEKAPAKADDSKPETTKGWKNVEIEPGVWQVTAPQLGVKKEMGVWRTIKGQRYFFPADGKPPVVPPLKGTKANPPNPPPAEKPAAKEKPAEKPAAKSADKGGGEKFDFVGAFNSGINELKKSGIDFAQSDETIKSFSDQKLLDAKDNFEYNYEDEKTSSFAILKDAEGKKAFTKWVDSRRALIDGELKKRGLSYKKTAWKSEAPAPAASKATAKDSPKATHAAASAAPSSAATAKTADKVADKAADKVADKVADKAAAKPSDALGDETKKAPDAKAPEEDGVTVDEKGRKRSAKGRFIKGAGKAAAAGGAGGGSASDQKAVGKAAAASKEDDDSWATSAKGQQLLKNLKDALKGLQSKKGKKVSSNVVRGVKLMIRGLESKSKVVYSLGSKMVDFGLPSKKNESLEERIALLV
jgi:hypothetical protein